MADDVSPPADTAPHAALAATARAGRGSRFDDFLRETRDYVVVTEAAVQRVRAWLRAKAEKAEGG